MSAVDLLDSLPPEHRARLLEAAVTRRLAAGELLLRRGEAGGDLFRLASGTLEVIDARLEPPVVLAVVGEGSLLGEMAFVDGSVRSADVRAAEACVCQHWRHAELLAILEAEPALGLAFYRALVMLATERSRNVREVALDGGRRGGGAVSSGFDDASDEVVARLRRRLLAVEPTLRSRAAGARDEVLSALDAFLDGLNAVAEHLGVHERPALLTRMGEHVQPWLIRSQLGELALAPPSGGTDDPLCWAHLLRGLPQGDGALGLLLDEWLLRLPTSHGLRARAEALFAHAIALRPRAVAVVNGGPTGLAHRVAQALPDADIATLDGPELTAWVIGDAHPEIRDRELVVVDGLIDSLPDRGAAAAFADIRGWLVPNGRMIGTSLLATPDAHLFRYVLGWPQVHRTERSVEALLTGAGFTAFASTGHGAGCSWGCAWVPRSPAG